MPKSAQRLRRDSWFEPASADAVAEKLSTEAALRMPANANPSPTTPPNNHHPDGSRDAEPETAVEAGNGSSIDFFGSIFGAPAMAAASDCTVFSTNAASPAVRCGNCAE